MEALNRFDTGTDTLPNGERRCDSRYKDYCETTSDVEHARCTRPTTLRIRVTSDTAQPDKAYEAMSCRMCYENALRNQGKQGYEAKVEALEG